MGGNDTTIGLSFGTRDMLKDLKIIPEETYDRVITRLAERVIEFEDKNKCILKIIEGEEVAEKKVEEIKKTLAE